eukprot:GILJ01010854.1.p1 GENE.GILJ01010854.1~~GILJ01010854.1.p1  ORF type:complete len:271 (+),score=40.60 GILJ01010854.1:99-911(+)
MATIERFYNESDELHRLCQGYGLLEKLRTQDILQRWLPSTPAVICDVGGGTGVYAIELAKQGYETHLFDIVPRHIEQAKEEAAKEKAQLATCAVGDARNVERPSESADAVLLLGPLYHLHAENDRQKVLREALRVLKPGGVVFCAGISRFSSLLDGLVQKRIDDEVFREDIVKNVLDTGKHENPTDNVEYFTDAYLHRPAELQKEVQESGFRNTEVIAIEGPGWVTEGLDERLRDSNKCGQLFELLRTVEKEPSIAGMSFHFMVIGKKQN